MFGSFFMSGLVVNICWVEVNVNKSQSYANILKSSFMSYFYRGKPLQINIVEDIIPI